jgi:hypothetical protein
VIHLLPLLRSLLDNSPYRNRPLRLVLVLRSHNNRHSHLVAVRIRPHLLLLGFHSTQGQLRHSSLALNRNSNHHRVDFSLAIKWDRRQYRLHSNLVLVAGNR